MNSIQDLLKKATLLLESVSDTPLLEAELLLAHVLKCKRALFYTWPLQDVSPDNAQAFYHLCNKRKAGWPIAYLLGTQPFWKFDLRVTPDVLIPRPETELLVERSLALFSAHEAISVIDLGTGSGAIALALAYERPNWQITGVDNSASALDCARQNAALLHLDTIQWKQMDWRQEAEKKATFSLVLSNPPYIAPDDPHLLDLHYEPQTALVAHNKGFADLHSILDWSTQHLQSRGYIVLEHGYDQAETLQSMMQAAGFTHIKTFLDCNQHPRVTQGQYI